MREAATHWRKTLKQRTAVAAVMLGLWAVGIEAKLVRLKVFDRADLAARAEGQVQHTLPAHAKRGDILDRKGRLLATSVEADSIYAVPKGITNPASTVAKLCDVFTDCTAKERQTLVDRLSSNKWSYVRRQVSDDVSKRVRALGLDGIGFLTENHRVYPNVELAAHVLGWVGIDSNGLSGIESAYDSQIKGRDGKILISTDAKRHAFDRMERPPVAGSSVELTIDEYLQHIAERELHQGVIENRAAGGSAIIMNPRTGEILALANEPTFDPNEYKLSSEDARRDRAVQDLYEPGSTFKIVTVSAALEEKVMGPDTLINTEPGRIQIGNRVVTENDGHDYGVIPLSDVIAKSSNVGAIKIGFKVGTETLSRFVSLFGFGRPVSPDFPSESKGIVWAPSQWTESALASVSMGYQVGVTPLQMAAAVSSVANGGNYVEPRVVRAVYSDGRRYVVQPKVLRRTIDPDTAASMTAIMEGVVGLPYGTATAAQMPGFTIAGKTGTAAKLVNGRYSHTEYNASFVGFVPSRSPALTIIVVIDSPHGPNRYFGGTVSAPIFKRIADASLRYLGVGPNLNPSEPVLVAREASGPALPASTKQAPESVVSLVSDGPIGTMPELTGMSARDAMRRLMRLGITPHITGQGVVVSQRPAPGDALEGIDVSELVLDRKSIIRPASGSHQ